jgi:phage terminase small subunit
MLEFFVVVALSDPSEYRFKPLSEVNAVKTSDAFCLRIIYCTNYHIWCRSHETILYG